MFIKVQSKQKYVYYLSLTLFNPTPGLDLRKLVYKHLMTFYVKICQKEKLQARLQSAECMVFEYIKIVVNMNNVSI